MIINNHSAPLRGHRNEFQNKCTRLILLQLASLVWSRGLAANRSKLILKLRKNVQWREREREPRSLYHDHRDRSLEVIPNYFIVYRLLLLLEVTHDAVDLFFQYVCSVRPLSPYCTTICPYSLLDGYSLFLFSFIIIGIVNEEFGNEGDPTRII